MLSKKTTLASTLVLSAVLALSGCTSSSNAEIEEEELVVIMEMNVIPLAAGTAYSGTSAGTAVSSNDKASVDYTNAADGYVIVSYKGKSTAVKVQITGPSGVTYTYNLSATGKAETFPFSDGNGFYKIGIFESAGGNKYSTAHTCTVSVSLKNEFAPFLNSNQYVNYADSTKLAGIASQTVSGKTTTMDKISAVYKYVVENYTYDYNLASTVQSGYLPNLDSMITGKKGICFDYASLMTAMLRQQGIPCKLVIGYTGNVYHAWINTYSAESGWVDSVIYFDGTTWKIMDPTFAATSNSTQATEEYIGSGSNYVAKYIY